MPCISMERVTRLVLPVLALVVATSIVLTGCLRGTDGVDRVVVRGTVTYNGKPVKDGNIRFVPQHGAKAPVSGGSIVNGQYEIGMRGGVPVGKHHVEITSFRKLPKRYADAPEGMVPKEQLLPKKYNTETELEQEIISGQSLTLDFPLGE